LGFEGVAPALTGRPSYHPAVPLKIYIYGYLNRLQSSRRLEREAQRNVELDTADRAEPEIAEAKTIRLNEKITLLKQQMVQLR